MISREERRKANVVQISAWIILGMIAKPTEDEVEMVIDAMLDIYPDMEEDAIEKYEKRPRMAAEIVLRKKTGDKQMSAQNAARQFLATEEARKVKKPTTFTPIPRAAAPHRVIEGILSLPYEVVRESASITERYGILIPMDAFERYIRAIETEKLVVLLDERVLARVMGPSDSNVIQVSPTIYRMLNGTKIPVRVQMVTDLQEIQKITFRYLGSEQEKDAIKEPLERLFVNLPGVALGQVFEVSPNLTVQVQALEPAMGFGSLPFDGQVAYELEPMRLEHRLVFCATCMHERPRFRMQGTTNVYFCGKECYFQ